MTAAQKSRAQDPTQQRARVNGIELNQRRIEREYFLAAILGGRLQRTRIQGCDIHVTTAFERCS